MTEGAKFAQENGRTYISDMVLECLFMECSALSGDNIEEIINKITTTIVYKIDSGEISQDLILNSRSIASKPADRTTKLNPT